MWYILDPNDIEDLYNPRTAKEVELIWKITKKLYKDAMKLWTKQTGGGPGHPENYYNFESRDPDNFSQYNKKFGSMLTWIYMLD